MKFTSNTLKNVIFVTATCCILPLTAFASNDNTEKSKRNFFGGIGVGATTVTIDYSQTDRSNAWDNDIKGAMGIAELGWASLVSQHFSLGARVRIDGNSGQYTEKVDEVTQKINSNYGFGVNGIAGYEILKNQQVYVTAGINWRNFKSNNYLTNSFNKTQAGYLIGVGYETMLTDYFGLTFEYNYANYGTFRAGSAKLSPSKQSAFISGRYYFM